jgi:hypothetical protein
MVENTTNTRARRGRPPRSTVPSANPVAAVEEAQFSAPVEAPVMERPPMRPAMRDEDPRAAAARRAAEIRGHLGTMDEGSDEFAAPPAPDGWTYEWKRKTVLGQEDPAYQVHLARMGWEPVSTARHPEMMPGMGNHPNIERKGMTLMQRPAVITEEARSVELRKARNQVKAKEAQLNAAPEGQFERDDPRVRPSIKKGYSPIDVPKD